MTYALISRIPNCAITLSDVPVLQLDIKETDNKAKPNVAKPRTGVRTETSHTHHMLHIKYVVYIPLASLSLSVL